MQPPSRARLWCALQLASLLCLIVHITPASAGELLAFPTIGALSSHADDDVNHSDEVEAALDIFYSMEIDSFQFLAEFVLNRKEREMERMQLGYASAFSYKIWLGRFHTPISYWNTAFHHGAVMQTAIARPGISAYEDDQGVMPMHTTGVLLEGSFERAQKRISYDVAFGIAPRLKESLAPMSISGQDASGKLSVSVKLGMQPVSRVSSDEIGVFAGYIEIPVFDRPFTQSSQTVAGAYFNREWTEWKFTGELTTVKNVLEASTGSVLAAFENIYIQGEYKAGPGWTGYARIEESNNAHNAYLALFPNFVNSRALFGARWEPFANHAINVEFRNSQQQVVARTREIAVQWSMVYP